MRDLKELENELRFAADAGCDYTLLIEAADALSEARQKIEAESKRPIFVVTAGEYSDYGIVAVTRDYKEARRIREEARRMYPFDKETVKIERYHDEAIKKIMIKFEVGVENGNILYCYAKIDFVKRIKEGIEFVEKRDHEYESGFKRDRNMWIVTVAADNDEHAKKIAKDYVMKKEAEAQDL